MITPTKDRLIIQNLNEEEKKTDSGFVFKTKEAITKGKVIEAGRDCVQIKQNDIIIYRTGAGDEVELDGIKYQIIREESVQAVLASE